jgi:hypothetical protein
LEQCKGTEQIKILAGEGKPLIQFLPDALPLDQGPEIHCVAAYQSWKFSTCRVAQNFFEIVDFAGPVIGEAHFRRVDFLKCAIRSKVITASLGKMEFSS